MCGIVAGISHQSTGLNILNALKFLEYRGYDSSGFACLNENKDIQHIRIAGKVDQLIQTCPDHYLDQSIGIAHTRWATHGQPNELNVHPHNSNNQISIVHNGIIENHQPLKQALQQAGYHFYSETDSEVIAHLAHQCFQTHDNPIDALSACMEQLKGNFAVALINAKTPDQLYGIRRGSPLVIGHSKHTQFISSDISALLSYTQDFTYLEDNDIAILNKDSTLIYSLDTGEQVERKRHQLDHLNPIHIEKGDFKHHMEKEIHQQPHAIEATIFHAKQTLKNSGSIFGDKSDQFFSSCQHIHIIACGTSYNAALCAQHWLHNLASIPCSVSISSEYRYQKTPVPKNTILIALSQSGETADTLAAFRQAKKAGYLAQVAICNVDHSSLIREADLHLITQAGPEIGVAATKTFTTQLTALRIFTEEIIRHQTQYQDEQSMEFWNKIEQLPAQITTLLQQSSSITSMAKYCAEHSNILFIARDQLWPIAIEGALKLKEISYIHAEAYAGGELKHGPLALVDKNMPIIVCAPNNHLSDKLAANIQEMQAREGQIILFADSDYDWPSPYHALIDCPSTPDDLLPILYSIPMQLLAYYTAVHKGTDVDQPRNLAKSVTVE